MIIRADFQAPTSGEKLHPAGYSNLNLTIVGEPQTTLTVTRVCHLRSQEIENLGDHRMLFNDVNDLQDATCASRIVIALNNQRIPNIQAASLS